MGAMVDASAKARETFTFEVQVRLNQLLDRAGDHNSSLCAIADQAFGVEGGETITGQDAVRDKRSGECGLVLDLLDTLSEALGRTRYQIDRLRAL